MEESYEYHCFGFCEYKQNTINSERMRIVNESNTQHSNHDANLVKKRSDVRKEEKLNGMEKVFPTDTSTIKAMGIKKILDKSSITFFSEKEEADIGNHEENDGGVLSAVSDCIILDDEKNAFNGIIGFDEKDNVVFIKIPHEHTINHDNTPIVSKYVGCLKSLLKKGKSKETRCKTACLLRVLHVRWLCGKLY